MVTPAKPLASAPKIPEPPNTIPAPAPDTAPTQAAQAPVPTPAPPPLVEPSRQQKLAALCETTFLRIQELPSAVYSHRGYCTKCGWQSMQHSADDAHTMTRQHVMQHWRDVAAQIT